MDIDEPEEEQFAMVLRDFDEDVEMMDVEQSSPSSPVPLRFGSRLGHGVEITEVSMQGICLYFY